MPLLQGHLKNILPYRFRPLLILNKASKFEHYSLCLTPRGRNLKIVPLACAADETKLLLNLSAKQREILVLLKSWYTGRGPRAMIDLLKMSLSICHQIEGKFVTHFREFVESVGGPVEQGIPRCFTVVTNRSQII